MIGRMLFLAALPALALNSGAPDMNQAGSDPSALLPNATGGWVASAADRAYTRDTLYDYIDGGAELYLSFGLRSVLSRRYSRPGQPDIVVDIFDMGTSHDAFGVFSLASEAPDTSFGQGSQYLRGLLLFWKDHYFVSVLATAETEESWEAVLSLTRSIEAAIPRDGPIPAIVSLLPPESLVRESIRYFRHHAWQNSHYYISTEDILNIDSGAEAVLAKYGEPGERYVILLVKYPSHEDAKAGHMGFVAHYEMESAEFSVVQVEDGTWTGAGVHGDIVTLVFNAPTEAAVWRLMPGMRHGGASD
jgi:hypothetical protein